jgi:hypothetical protein
MGDVLDEAQSIMQCKDCPWYKSCILPMRFTAEDIRRQLEQSSPGANYPTDMNLQTLLSNLSIAAQNTLLEGCPVLIERLRASPRLTQRVKELMQNWGKELEDKRPPES